MYRSLRNVTASLAAVLLAACAAGTPPSPAPTPATFPQALAERNYVVGEQIDRLADFRPEQWEALDGKHLIVFNYDARGYLITFLDRCYGLATNRLQHVPRSYGYLRQYDTILVRHEGNTIDHCRVQSVNVLAPAGAS